MANGQNILNVRILHAYKPAASWDKTTVLKQGEVGFESDTGKWKVGDGATTWEKLAYMVDKYALPLSGGTLSGTVFFGTTNYYIDAQANANLKSLNVDEYVKVGNGSKFYANNSGEGYFSHNLGIGVEPDDDYSLKVADNSYFYGDILLGDKKQIRRNGNEVTWIGGRDGAMIRQMSYSGYSPVFSAKTTDGDWSFGPYSNNILYLTYCTDLKYNEGKNEPAAQFIFYPSGNFVSPYIGINGSNTEYRFYVNGSSFLNGDIIHNGTIYLANGKTYYINNNAQAYFNRIGIGTPPSSDYLLIVNGISHLKGDTRISGNIYMTNGNSSICWDNDSYRQRILTTDDATNDTAVFTFQQSSDQGSSWSTLFTIKDNGKIVVPNDVIANKSIRNLEIGGGIYWNPYVESSIDGSDVASITVIKNGSAGGTELRISQQNDATDIINLVTNSYIYLNGKRAFQINDSWLRINQDLGFSSGIYTGQSMIRTDSQFQIGDNGNKFYVNSSGNGYINNTLGIGGIDTSYKLYVNGISYLKGNTTYGGHIYADTNYAYDIGQNTKEFKNLYTRAIAARHIDADAVFTGDHYLYIGYGSAAYTTEIKMYYSSSLENRIEYFRINSNGAYALTRFGVNGQNTSYTFYVNGTNYLNGDTTINGNLYFTNSSKQIRWTCGDNDYGRIFCSHTGSNAGYMEIATADDTTEPIYVRQYDGVFSALNTTLTLLDGSHNTIIPNALTVGTGTSQGANYKFYVNGLSYFNGDISRVGNIYPLENNTKILGSSSLKWANIYATTFTGNLNGSADRLDDWHLNEVKRSGFITSGTSGLSSYWFPIWNGTFTDKKYNDYTLDLWITSGFNDKRGIISFKVRQNGNNNSGAYNFDVTLRITNGNLDKNSFKLFYNNSTGNVQLWANVGGQYGVLNYTVLSETWRTSNNLNKVGTLTAQNFASVQTQPSSGYSSITASWQNAFSSDADTVDGYHHDAFVKRVGDTMTGQLYIHYHQDVGKNQNGSLIIGEKAGKNIAIDNDEIMSRNNSAVATLYLNNEGGNVSINGYTSTSYALSTPSFICNSWIRTVGSTGWYNESYGGGWYMTDSNFIRSYGSKAVSINIASNNAWGIGTHRLAAVFKGNDHVSILLSTNSLGYGLCVNNNGNWYWGKRTTSSETSTSGDTYLLQGNTTLVRPSTNMAIGLGEVKSSEFSNAYIRAIHTRHLDASGVYSSDMDLYIGYGAGTPTQRTLFYYSTGAHGENATSRTQFAEINSNGLYALTRFGVNGQNTSYKFYVNGNSYFSSTTYVYKDLNIKGNESTDDSTHLAFKASDNSTRAFICFNGNVDNSYNSSTHLKIATYWGDIRLSPATGSVNFCKSSIRNLAINGGIYWDPYVESSTDASDVASITVIKNGCAGGTELRINQQNDATDVINLVTNAYIYLNGKRAFQINDSWLRINQDLGFSSGIYFGSSIVRTDNQFQIGDNGNKFYVNSSGNGYFSNTLGIGGTNTSYRLYVKGDTYFSGTNWVSGSLNIGNIGYGDYPLAVSVKSLFQEDMTCSKVTVRSGLYLTSWSSSTYGGKINFGDGDYVHLYEIADDKLEIKSNYTWLTSNVAIGLGSGSTTTYNEHKLYVNGSGYFSSIGIFGTNTSYRLFVNGSSYFNSSVYVGSTIYFGGGTTYYVNASATSYLFHLSIGGVNTSYKLYVNGSSYFNGALTFYGSDSFGIFTTRTNYGSIGSSSYKWYRSYINNMYGTVSSSGSDYAEFFEWADSNTNNEDRVGLFVTFDEKYPKKIRIANEKDTYILGIVSGKPSIIGNSDEDSYKYQYETDDFGRYIYEDKEHKKIKERETYDKTKKYIPRSERQEWDTIGMLGVLPIKDNGLCEVGGYCKCGDNGIAIPSDFGYRIVERISKNVIKVVFK